MLRFLYFKSLNFVRTVQENVTIYILFYLLNQVSIYKYYYFQQMRLYIKSENLKLSLIAIECEYQDFRLYEFFRFPHLQVLLNLVTWSFRSLTWCCFTTHFRNECKKVPHARLVAPQLAGIVSRLHQRTPVYAVPSLVQCAWCTKNSTKTRIENRQYVILFYDVITKVVPKILKHSEREIEFIWNIQAHLHVTTSVKVL